MLYDIIVDWYIIHRMVKTCQVHKAMHPKNGDQLVAVSVTAINPKLDSPSCVRNIANVDKYRYDSF